MIKMVAFDLFGVVIREGHMISGTLMPLLPKKTSKSIVKSFYNPYTRGEISEADFWQGVGQKNHQKLREYFLNSFILDVDLEWVLEELSEKYNLSILSNLGKDWADMLIDKFQFEQMFSPIIVSGEVGCEKPNLRIYELLIAQSRFSADEIIFIDDRLENLASAHAVGMKTIHYKREVDSFDYQADYQIQKLRDLLGLL